MPDAEPPVGDRFAVALAYAAGVHAGQTRKGTGSPYLSHLLIVAGLVLEAGASEQVAIAALLHDAAEDGGGQVRLDEIGALFGDEVAGIVAGCSDSLAADPARKADWLTRKRSYVAHLNDPRTSADVLLVAAADKAHNCEATVADVTVDPKAWSRFNPQTNPRLIAWYYRSCLEAFRAARVSPALLARLAAAVQRLELLVPVDDEEPRG